MARSIKIAFIYPSFFPLRGGSSIHGYHLAEELSKYGYQLTSFNEQRSPICENKKKTVINLLYEIAKADLVYVRINLRGYSSLIPGLARFAGKKVVAELNGPPDELKIGNKLDQKLVDQIDQQLKKRLQAAHRLITVSPIMETYCKEVLEHPNVKVVENGGEYIDIHNLHPSGELKNTLDLLKKQYHKVAIWSGSNYPWQGINTLKELIDKAGDEIAFLLVSNDKGLLQSFPDKLNVKKFCDIPREDVKYLIQQADIGLVLYDDFSWNRFGDFYGSSLKFYEYMINGLTTIASPVGHIKADKHPGLHLCESVDCMWDVIKNYTHETRIRENYSSVRSWQNVGQETALIIKDVLENNS